MMITVTVKHTNKALRANLFKFKLHIEKILHYDIHNLTAKTLTEFIPFQVLKNPFQFPKQN